MSARRSPRPCPRPASSMATLLARSAKASRWRRCDATGRGTEIKRANVIRGRCAVGPNIEAVGYSNLNDKPGFKMSIQKVGERWYLYIGMLWNEGWQIVDVTDLSLIHI